MTNTDDLSVFLEESFDPDAFASNILASNKDSVTTSTVEDCVSSLTSYLTRIDGEITKLVERNECAMISKSSSMDDLKSKLSDTTSEARSLEISMHNIRTNILDPYRNILKRSVQLERIQTTSNLLRRIMRLQFAVSKLRTQIKSSSEDQQQEREDTRKICKAAQSLQYVEKLVAAEDLKGIEIIDKELDWIREAGRTIRVKARRALRIGMRSLSQAEVGSALQIFHVLGCLEQTFGETIKKTSETFRARCEKLLNMSIMCEEISKRSGTVSKKFNPNPSDIPAWRKNFWIRFNSLMESLYGAALQIWTLYRVAIKKRDTRSNKRFVDFASSNGTKTPEHSIQTYWINLTSILTTTLQQNSKKSQFLRSVLVKEYPRARESMSQILKRLRVYTSKGSASDLGMRFEVPVMCNTVKEKDCLLGSLAGFLEIYLARSIARLNKPLNLMWPETQNFKKDLVESAHHNVPTSNDVQTFGRVMEKELQNARRDLGLLMAIARGAVTSAVRMFAARAENFLAPSYSDPWRLSKQKQHITLTKAQRRNRDIFERLQQLKRILLQLTKSDVNRGDHLVRALGPASKCVDELSRQIMSPYVLSASKQLDLTILGMHSETFSDKNTSTETSSFYIRRLCSSISILKKYFQCFTSNYTSGMIREIKIMLCRHVICNFVRHASLIRPLSETGKLRLTQDMTQLELSLSQIVSDTSSLGWVYEELRAFRQLLFLETNAAAQLPRHELSKFRPSTFSHHLIGRGPVELEHPIDAVKESDLKGYTKWILDTARAVQNTDEDEDENDALVSLPSVPSSTSLDSLELFSRVYDTPSCTVENAIWKRVQMCLDKYAQRMSSGSNSGIDLCAEYHVLVKMGPVMIRGFRAQCAASSSSTTTS